MAKKEISHNDIQKNIEYKEMNLSSRLIEKLLEDQIKKTNEGNIINPTRFSQTIKPNLSKINSVLTSVKKQVVNDEKAKLFNANSRSTTERELQMSVNSNFQALMDLDREFKQSPFHLNFKNDHSKDKKSKFQLPLQRDKNIINTPSEYNKIVKSN